MVRPVVSRHHFPRADARAAIVPWCQDFYNVKRGHSSQRCWLRTGTKRIAAIQPHAASWLRVVARV